MTRLVLDTAPLALEDVERVARGGDTEVVLGEAARARIEAAREVVDRAVDAGRVVYGLTTGFGALAEVVIPVERITELQKNLIRSHAAGVGEPLPEPEVRAIMLLRANVLALGHSGVRPVVVERILDLLNHRIHPVVPSRGSVGASGDLAPLSHIALALMGEGEVLVEGSRAAASDAMRAAGLEPVELAAKEGLALNNGTQAMTGVGTLALLAAERAVETAEVAGAMSLEAMRGTPDPFDEALQRVRPQPGQITSAARLRALLRGSEIRESHRENDPRVQDAYSLRCMPQVHGAARDALDFVERAVAVEMNAATDNPMVFADTGEILSGGNFHGQPVAIAADVLAIVVAELGAISERRTERLVNPSLSGLPAFLARDGGLHSGLMMAQVTAAALASENKVLAHPASVDSIPTSAGKEDHVSMGATAAHKAARAVANTARVLAIELIAAAEALEFRRPLRSSPALEAVHARLRERVAPHERDRVLGPEIEETATALAAGEFLAAAEAVCGTLQ